MGPNIYKVCALFGLNFPWIRFPGLWCNPIFQSLLPYLLVVKLNKWVWGGVSSGSISFWFMGGRLGGVSRYAHLGKVCAQIIHFEDFFLEWDIALCPKSGGGGCAPWIPHQFEGALCKYLQLNRGWGGCCVTPFFPFLFPYSQFFFAKFFVWGDPLEDLRPMPPCKFGPEMVSWEFRVR